MSVQTSNDTQTRLTNESRSDNTSADDRLVQVRLGIHVSLFHALRAKHPPTAAHCLRVALTCSKWAIWRKLPDRECDWLEVAALLHDIGKIGVPDEILQKPAELNEHEKVAMETQRSLADQLLSTAGAEPELVSVVRAARLPLADAIEQGIDHPLSSMLAIVDAYDSMTIEQVFRRALSHEAALQELCANAGTQFDPSLVKDFSLFISEPRQELELQTAKRWLSELKAPLAVGFSKPQDANASKQIVFDEKSLEPVFHRRFLDAMPDAAVYLGSKGQILNWNRAAEQLVGRQAGTVLHRRWTSELMGLYNLDGTPIDKNLSPLERLRETNTQFNENYLLRNRLGKELPIYLRAIPVFSKSKENCGTILLLRDATQQVKLERKVASLHKIASSDPLTKVGNRAELNRQLPKFLELHLAEGNPGSMIICDIDFFKRINDKFGHQAGDEALVTFAGLLRESAREDDFVARFGGEEFVILCAGCDNSTATFRADQMRKTVESTPVPALKNKNMTSSFGVTELQPGDTIETFLARADRALMRAKESGRNRVIQLGSGQDIPAAKEDPAEAFEEAANPAPSNWLSWFSTSNQPILTREFLAAVPNELALQKLQGFIHDHGVEVESSDKDSFVLKLRCSRQEMRNGDRLTTMRMRIEITEVQFSVGEFANTSYQTRTRFRVSVIPYRARDRREGSLRNQAIQVLLSFQSYLVAQRIDDSLRAKIIEPR
ncbi:MAG: diguanylate cyclase [Planctomycetota bacterium]